MDIIIACHCPEPIHSKLMIYEPSKGWIHLIPSVYTENGIKSLQYAHPTCATPWDTIANSSVDIVYTVHCPIALMTTSLAKNKSSSITGSDIITEMYNKLRSEGYIITHVPIPKGTLDLGDQRRDTFAQNIQYMFPDAAIQAFTIYRDEFGTKEFPVVGIIKDSHLSQAEDKRMLLVAIKITKPKGGRRKNITYKRRYRKQKKTRVHRRR